MYHKPVISILSLPTELLAAIAAVGQEDRMQWTLSHVSRRLRTVMVGTPVLWTSIEGELDSSRSFSVLRLYLERSQKCPIALTLRQRWAFPDSDRRLRLKILVPLHASEIILHFNRVSRLIVLATRWGIELMLRPFLDLAAPNLQHLEVTNLFDEYPWSPVELFLAGAPRLQVLRLYALTLELPVPQWATSLTHLELRRSRAKGDKTKKALKEFLGQCSMLVYLYLDVSSTVLQGRVHLPSLESLYLDFSGSERGRLNLPAIVNFFDAPSLADLGVNNVHGDQIFELLMTPSLPGISFSALTSLSFVSTFLECDCEHSRTFPHSSPLPATELFPAVSSLTLLNICFTPNIVKGLLAWPVLRTVALCPRADAMEDVRVAVLAAMRSYVQHGVTIPVFRLAPALSRLRHWQENGMVVEALNPSEALRPFY
ncbi:hypothetical protein C8R45DRAFT_987217 [Mycena sanguinolenta]|nr:hypothetical protein C8R45DRAFT_987217 [Mycena sanguinolenta]